MGTTADELIPTRATLLQRLKNWQDESSWQMFFDTYWKLIYGVAIKGGLTRAEAEDAVQETLMSVAKHMPGFKYDPAIGSFKAWLLNMTRWRITDQLRKRGFQPGFRDDSGEPEPGQEERDEQQNHSLPDLEKLWDAEWEKNLLSVAIGRIKRRLDPKQYQIFDCYVNKNWPPGRVAKALDISLNQVYLAKHRVAESIKQEVERLKNEMF